MASELKAKLSIDTSEFTAGVTKAQQEGANLKTALEANAPKLKVAVDSTAVVESSKTASEGMKTKFTEANDAIKAKLKDTFSADGSVFSSLKGSLSTVLGVFGGGALLGGVSGLVGGFKSLVEAGKGAATTTNNWKLAFSQLGLSAEETDKLIKQTAKSTGEIANKYGLATSEVRKYQMMSASLGGATGKTNDDLTKMAIAIEKSTQGMVSGEMAVRLFSKGVSDPESQFAMQRLTKQFPQLGAALKGVTDPAKAMEIAMKQLGPTLGTLEKNAEGSMGASQKLANSFGSLKAKIGTVIFDGIAPLFTGLANSIVPAIGKVADIFVNLLKYVKPLAPYITAIGVAIGVYVLAVQGAALATSIWSGAVALLNGTMALNPIGLIVVGIVALAAGFVLLYKNSEAFRNVIDTVWASIKSFGIGVYNAIVPALSGIWDFIKGVFTLLYDNFETVKKVLLVGLAVMFAPITLAVGTLYGAFKAFQYLFREFGDDVKEAFSIAWKNVTDTFNSVYNSITKTWNTLKNFFSELYKTSGVFRFFTDPIISIFNTVYNKVVSVWNTIKAFFGSIADGISYITNLGKSKPTATDKKQEQQSKANAEAAKVENKAVANLNKAYADLQAGTIQAAQAKKISAEASKLSILEAGRLQTDAEKQAYNAEYLAAKKQLDDLMKTKKPAKSATDKADELQTLNNLKEQNKLELENMKQRATDADDLKFKISLREKELGFIKDQKDELVKVASTRGITYDMKDNKFTFPASVKNDIKLKYEKLLLDATKEGNDVLKDLKTLNLKYDLQPLEAREQSRKAQEEADKMDVILIKANIELGTATNIDLASAEYKNAINSLQRAKEAEADYTEKYTKEKNEANLKALNSANAEKIKATIEVNKTSNALELANKKFVISQIKDLTKQQYEFDLLALETKHDAELLSNSENTTKQLAIEVEYQNKKQALMQDYANKNKSFSERLLNSTMDSLGAAFSNMTIELPDSSNAQKQLSDLDKKRQDSIDNYKKGASDYQSLQTQLNDIDKERTKVIESETGKQKALLMALNKALSTAFKAQADESRANLTTNTKQYKNNIQAKANLEKELKDITDKTSTDYINKQKQIAELTTQNTDAMSQAWGDFGVILGGTFAASVVEGKSAMKSLVLSVLAAMKAIIPMYIAWIYAAELASKSFAGLVTAGLLTGLLTGLVAVAEASVKTMNFAKGGLSSFGFGEGLKTREQIVIGRVAETGRPEFVMNPNATASNLPMLKAINRGEDPLRYLGNNKFTVDNSGLIFEMQAQRAEIQGLRSDLNRVKLVETNHNYNMTVTKNEVVKATKAQLYRI